MSEIITLKNLNDAFTGFIGTENYYRHWLPGFFFTDGIKSAVDKFSSYWLLDVIFSYQPQPKVSGEKFQIWTIASENKRAAVEMRADDDQPVLVRQDIPYTDFPEGRFKMYYVDDGSYKVLLLPSEY